MKKSTFDIHDRNVTAIVYQLMFATIEIDRNDTWHEIIPIEMFGDIEEIDDCYKERWEERLRMSPHNCYFNNVEMKNLHDNPITIKDAILHFYNWLENNGFKKDEEILVKMWW